MKQVTTFQGLKVHVETPKGQWRIDRNHTPPQWKTKMLCDYGEIVSSLGVDGDAIDVFLGPNPDAAFAYIVRQLRPDSGEFDEQKTMLGFDTAGEAKAMYLRHYDTPKFFGGIQAMPMAEFKLKALSSLHGEKLLKSLANPALVSSFDRFCKSMDALQNMEKGVVAGHFLTTHGGKRVWVEPYEDARVMHQRPADEQKPRAGDSISLFPEIGQVRPIPQPRQPKPAAPSHNQLSMFADFKSLPSMDETAAPVTYERDDLRDSVASAAFQAALCEACEPAQVVALAAARRAQAEAFARQFLAGLVGESNLSLLCEAARLPASHFTGEMAAPVVQESTVEEIPL